MNHNSPKFYALSEANKKKFVITSDYKPNGDQPNAINSLVKNIKKGENEQVLLGVTGSGKTLSLIHI